MKANLENPVYQQTVLNNNTRGDLIELISGIDDKMDYRDTIMFQDDFDLVGGRLPTADKRIVAKSGFTEVITKLFVEYSSSIPKQKQEA